MDVEKVKQFINECIKYPHPSVTLSSNEARALLTEIEYWKARCGKAEGILNFVTEPEITNCARPAWESHQASVAGEADKALYLETLKMSPVE